MDANGQRRTARSTTTWQDRVKKSNTNNYLYVFQMSLVKAELSFPGVASEAARTEMAQLLDRETIIPIKSVPKGAEIIHSKLFLTPKHDMEGNLIKIKLLLAMKLIALITLFLILLLRLSVMRV